MAPSMQKAVFVYEVGKPVRLGKREIPSPKAGELLVKVTSAQGTCWNLYGSLRRNTNNVQSCPMMHTAVIEASSSATSSPGS